MTVSNITSVVQYTGNGATIVWPTGYRFFKNTDLVVVKRSVAGVTTLLTLNTDYSVSGAGSLNGGTVTTTNALAAGELLTIARVLNVQQLTDLRNQGDYFAEIHEDVFDYLTMLIQQTAESDSRALRHPRDSEHYQAEARRIVDLEDPVDNQDATTKGWTSLFISSLISAIQGPINNALNVFMTNVLGFPKVVQNIATGGSGEGDAMVAVKQQTANSVLLSQHDLNLERVSLQQYGGKDDYNGTTGTNSFAALNNILTDYPNGCVIRLPKTVGGTGRYLLTGTAGSSDMSKYVIDNEYGVDITVSGNNTPLIAPGLKVTRPLNIRLQTLGYTYRLSPVSYGDLSGKPYIMSTGDGEAPLTDRLITSSTDMSFNTVNPTSGAQAPVTPASADGNIASFNNIPTTGFTVGHFPIRPGQEFHAQVTMPSMTGSVCAYVQTENGWIIFSQDLAGGNITRRVFLEGNSVQSVTINDPLADNPAYQFWASEIGIKVHSPTSFSLLMNHVEIARLDDITSNIIRAGWGAGLVNNTNPAYITYPYRVRGKRSYGIAPKKLVIVGDSTATKLNPFSWVNHFIRTASGVGGVQFKNVLNMAVAGETSIQQAARFNSTDFQALGGFDYALIDVGINDIGGAILPADFMTAINGMLATCVTYNMIPLIAMPGMFYNQTAATPYGQVGQNTGNADRGAPYRLQLQRRLAELGLQANFLSLEDMGAIVPSLLANPDMNPVVQDNIHQSNWGGELKGGGHAKAFLGYLFARTRKDIASRAIKPAWIPAAVAATYGTAAKPTFRVNGDQFSMAGLMDCPASVPANTDLVALPAAYAPPVSYRICVPCADVSSVFNLMAFFLVGSNGIVRALSTPATARYYDFGAVTHALQS